MENYYELEWDFTTENQVVGETFEPMPITTHENYVIKSRKGESLGLSKVRITIKKNAHPICADAIYSGTNLVVSDRFKTLLQKFELHLEFVSVDFIGAQADSKYWFCNILDNLDVFDWSHSKYEARNIIRDGQIVYWSHKEFSPARFSETLNLLDINTLKFKETEIADRHLFQVKYLEVHKFVSRELKEAIEAAGITGVKFIPLSEFTSGF